MRDMDPVALLHSLHEVALCTALGIDEFERLAAACREREIAEDWSLPDSDGVTASAAAWATAEVPRVMAIIAGHYRATSDPAGRVLLVDVRTGDVELDLSRHARQVLCTWAALDPERVPEVSRIGELEKVASKVGDELFRRHGWEGPLLRSLSYPWMDRDIELFFIAPPRVDVDRSLRPFFADALSTWVGPDVEREVMQRSRR